MDNTKERLMNNTKERLEYLRGELRGECMSYDELHELQCLAPYIEDEDVELLQAAGVPEGAVRTRPITG